MMSAEQTSAEKLEHLLASGKISRDDYDRLRGAMQKKESAVGGQGEAGSAATAGAAGDVKTLKKSWAKRQIGGVCGGFGDYFRIDPLIVRIITVVSFLVAGPLTIVAYIALYFVLPWDEPAAAHEPQRQGRPYAFGATIFLLCWLFPVLIMKFSTPLKEVYADLGAELPTLTQLAFYILHVYQMYALALIPIIGIISALMTGLYLICHNPTLRRIYAAICIISCLLWPILLLVSIYVPLIGLRGTTQ